MTTTTKSEIAFAITATTTRLQEGLRRAESQIREFARRTAAAGDTGKAGKQFSLESLAKAGLVVSAGINAANIASKAMAGNIQEAAEAVKSLPLGVGQMAKVLESVLGDWTGINREIKYCNELMAAQNKFHAAAARHIEAQQKALAALAERRKQLVGETRLIGLEGPAAAKESERQRHEKELADIEARKRAAMQENNRLLAEKSRAAKEGPATDAEVMDLARSRGLRKITGRQYDELAMEAKALRNARLGGTFEADRARKEAQIIAEADAAAAAETARHEKQMSQIRAQAWRERIAGARKWLSEMAGQLRQRAAEEVREQQRAGQQIADADSQIRQKRLEAEGRALDAELERIRHYYAQRIEEARKAGRAELAARLETLQKLDEAKAVKADALKAADRKAREDPAAAGALVAELAAGTMYAGGGTAGIVDRMKAFRQRMADRVNERYSAWMERSRGVQSSWDSGGGGTGASNEVLKTLREIAANTRGEKPMVAQ